MRVPPLNPPPTLQRRQRELDAGEVEQVRALRGVEAQNAGQGVEDVRRRLDVPPLLEEGVPGRTDPGEHGHHHDDDGGQQITASAQVRA